MFLYDGLTTLLNIIAGFLTPTNGRVTLDGNDITSVPPERRGSATSFQSYALFPHLSVQDNVAFGPRQKEGPDLENPATGRKSHRPDGAVTLCRKAAQRSVMWAATARRDGPRLSCRTGYAIIAPQVWKQLPIAFLLISAAV